MTFTGAHKDIPFAEVGISYSFEYADATARNAAAGLTAADEGKFARQLDDDSIWMLTDYTGPTWKEVGSSITLANVSEAAAGTSTTKAVTPAGMQPGSVDVSSNSTTNIGAAASLFVRITGTTTITAFDNVAAGIRRIGYFAGALTLTHNGTSLILPGAANITTAAGDSFEAISLGSGNWKVVFYQKADGTPIAGGGGVGTLLKNYWSPDAPPASPSGTDSEFDGGSSGVPSGFTEYDPGSILTVTESNTKKDVQLSHATIAGTLDIAGIYKAIPAGDFTIWTKYHFYGTSVNYAFIGLCLWEDATDSTKKIAGYGLSPRNNTLLNNGLYTQTNYNTFNTATENNFNFIQSTGYLQLRRNSTNYYLRYSNDGLSFFGGGSALNPGFTPTHFGVGMGNTTGATLLGTFDFFRYVASDVGLNGILAGQLAGIYQ